MSGREPGETQLYQVGPKRSDHRIEVVFVHGLGGDWKTTWGGQKNDETFWPQWIADDVPQARVWSAQYPAAPSGWMGRSLGALGVVTSLLDRMSVKELGSRPIVLICHSLGGLIAKQLLKTALDLTANDEWNKIGRAVRGVVFIATPHSGSDLANNLVNFATASGLLGFFFRIEKSLIELQKNRDQLEELGDWYRAAASEHKVATLVYAEGHPVNGVITVVPKSSANPGIARITAIELAFDHFEICKPRDRTYQVYEGTVNFVHGLIQEEKRGFTTQSRSREQEPQVAGPKIELSIIEPKGSIVLPRVVDLKTILHARIDAESDRMGIQSIDWVNKTLEQYYLRKEAAEKSLIAANKLVFHPPPAETPLEEYALELEKWYEWISLVAIGTCQAETRAVRAVKLRFRLQNSGTVPADKLELEIWVMPALIEKSRPNPESGRLTEEAPIPDASLGLPTPKDTKRPKFSWYDLSASEAARREDQRQWSSDAVELFETDLESEQKFLRMYPRLQHGKTMLLRPIYVVFEDAASDIEIEYKIYAENMPSVSAGRFRITVSEQ